MRNISVGLSYVPLNLYNNKNDRGKKGDDVMIKTFFGSILSAALCFLLMSCANCKQMNTLQIGMTEAEAIKIMDRQPDKISADARSKTIIFSCRGSMPTSAMRFVNNSLVAYGPEDDIKALASLPPRWMRPDAGDTQTSKDLYECTRQADNQGGGINVSQNVQIGGPTLPSLIMEKNARDEAARHKSNLIKMCMEARGYKQSN